MSVRIEINVSDKSGEPTRDAAVDLVVPTLIDAGGQLAL
jgi:hypothetical protein